jgi:excisionase family DNA binding protein
LLSFGREEEMMTTRELLKPADVAAELGVTPRRIYQLIAERELPATRVGGAIRLPRAAWEEWLRRKSDVALASLRDEGPSKATNTCD